MTDLEKATRLKNHYIIHIAAYAFMFNLLPALLTSLNMVDLSILMLFVGFPVIIYILSIIFALYNRFQWLYIFFATVLFIPSAFIYYNYTALVYAILYGSSAALGMLVGIVFLEPFVRVLSFFVKSHINTMPTSIPKAALEP